MILLMFAALIGGTSTAALLWPEIGPWALVAVPFGGSLAAGLAGGLLVARSRPRILRGGRGSAHFEQVWHAVAHR